MKIKRIEHIAVAVRDIRAAMGNLEHTLGLKLEYDEQLAGAKLAMYPVGETYIELLEGTGPETETQKWIDRHGEGLFHLCFEVEDIDGALDELRAKGVKLIDETPRIGHGGCRIAFLDPASTGSILIELAEMPANHA
jgi:methylmalonyl-CoA epimerase